MTAKQWNFNDMGEQELKVVKTLIKEVYSLKAQHNNKKLKDALEECEMLVKNNVVLADVSQAKRAVCPDCFDRWEIRNDKEEIIGTCPCHY